MGGVQLQISVVVLVCDSNSKNPLNILAASWSFS